MTDFEHEHEVPASEYGRWRREQWLVEKQANLDAMTQAAMEAHRADHAHITRSTHGIFGAMTGHQLGQAAAERQATVGGEWGQGRPLERNGGLYDDNLGPAPARRDLRYVNTPGQQLPGESPLAAFMRNRERQ